MKAPLPRISYFTCSNLHFIIYRKVSYFDTIRKMSDKPRILFNREYIRMYERFIFLFQDPPKIVMEMIPLTRLTQKEQELIVRIFLQLEI